MGDVMAASRRATIENLNEGVKERNLEDIPRKLNKLLLPAFGGPNIEVLFQSAKSPHGGCHPDEIEYS
jgi:hypothetical protein